MSGRVATTLLAAGTTVLGVIPLLPDPFWNAMAAAIMAGLTVGGTLTILLYPTLSVAAVFLTSRYGPSTKAFIVVPLVGAFFVDLLNAGTINFFIRLIQRHLV